MWRGCRCGEAGTEDGTEDTEAEEDKEDTEAGEDSAAPGGQSTGLGTTRAGLSTKRCRKLATWAVRWVIIYCGENYFIVRKNISLI